MKSLAAVALGLALPCAAPAVAQPVPFPDTPAAAELPPGATTRLSVFRAEALRADAVSLATSRIALTRARDPAVLDYARRVIAHRTATSQALAPAEASADAADPAADGERAPGPGVALEPADRTTIDRLRSERRQDRFERDYVAEQARSDTRMLALYQGFYRTGDTAQGRRFAYEALPYIETDRARSAELNDLYGG